MTTSRPSPADLRRRYTKRGATAFAWLDAERLEITLADRVVILRFCAEGEAAWTAIALQALDAQAATDGTASAGGVR